MTTTQNTTAVDFDRIAGRMTAEMHKMLHEENWHGPDQDRYATALRRALGFEAAGEGFRALPYDRLQTNFGLTTNAEADFLRDAHTVADRMGRESAERQVTEIRAELRRVYREARKDLAGLIRETCNERVLPARLRREGAAWAADLLDPPAKTDGDVR